MSESYSLVFAVPKHYKLNEEHFRKKYKQCHTQHNDVFFQKVFQSGCKTVEGLTGGGGFVHCQDTEYWEMWEPLIEVLRDDLVLVSEFINGSVSGGDTIESISHDTLEKAFISTIDIFEVFKRINKP